MEVCLVTIRSATCGLIRSEVGTGRPAAFQHDLDYLHQIGKALADARLEHCVNAILPGMGTIMFIGVTLFGALWYAAARRKRA